MSATTEVITTFVPFANSKKHTPAFKIFHYKFLCQMAQMHLVSTEYLEQIGSVTSGDARIDRSMAEQKVTVQLTIAGMSEYHSDGVPFELVSREDSARIYRILFDHLSGWQLALQQQLNLMEAPIEDLRKLDALAGEIYIYARHYLQERPFHGKMANLIESLTQRRAGIRRSPVEIPGLTRAQEQANNLPKQHTPMADSIAALTSERRKSWQR